MPDTRSIFVSTLAACCNTQKSHPFVRPLRSPSFRPDPLNRPTEERSRCQGRPVSGPPEGLVLDSGEYLSSLECVGTALTDYRRFYRCRLASRISLVDVSNCQESTRSRLSGISPVHTWFSPPLAPPHKGEGNPRSSLPVAPGQTPPSQLVSFVFDPLGLTPPLIPRVSRYRGFAGLRPDCPPVPGGR